MSAFPLLDDYSIPDGTNNTTDLNGIAPRYTVDITQADAATTGLTYQYTNAPVTYDFGYGLSYTTYEYGELSIGEQDTDGNFTATVSVTNTGDKAGAEIVELYASNPILPMKIMLLRNVWLLLKKLSLIPERQRK